MALLPLVWLTAGPVRAEVVLPASPWIQGEVASTREPWRMSWWYAEVDAGYSPRVEVEGEGTASAYCPQLAPAQPETCMVYAWGNWTRVSVDGRVIAWRADYRAYIPVVYGR